jgi:hypothetical protein
LARHCTEAGLIEKAAGLWGKAGQRSLDRSALVEASEQLARALDQIATLPPTPALRRQQIELQVALITPLMHVKGHAAPETRAAGERARLLIEQAEILHEPIDDPLLLFSVLYGFWITNYVAFNGEVLRTLAAEFFTHAERQTMTAPLVISHRISGITAFVIGEMDQCEAHFDQALKLYDPADQRLGHYPIWPKQPGKRLDVSLDGAVDARLSRSCAWRRPRRSSRGARNRSRSYAAADASILVHHKYVVWELRLGKQLC